MTAAVNLAYQYPILGAFWTVFLFALAVLWLILLFRVITDIFRDDVMSGGVKAAWLVFVILLPFLGVFVYVAARGRRMGQREQAQAQERQEKLDSYIRTTTGIPPTQTEQLSTLTEMHDSGTLSDEEFRRAKEKVLH